MSEPTAAAATELKEEGLAPKDRSDLPEAAAKLKVSSEGPETNGHGDGEDEEDDDEEEGVAAAGGPVNGAAKKKKKKKKPKKKKAAVPTVQSSPPRVPVSTFFPSGNYPEGECSPYLNDNAWRTTSEEKRHLERLAAQEDASSPDNYNAIRRAAEVHRQVRRYARDNIKPGMKMVDIAEMIEDGTRALVEAQGMQRGIGFPTGLSRNHCAAHYTPNFGDTTVLQDGDILKVDFGVQVNGRILDSAFTISFDDRYDNLLKAVRSATNAGIREAGIDARLSDLGAIIQETMESYEVEVDGKTHRVKSIQNLTGHTILPYQIHGHKTVPIVAGTQETAIMEEGDYFAIETFGSTGRGYVEDEGETSHYAKNTNEAMYKPLALQGAKDLWKVINREFGTLPFCRRYLDYAGQKPPSYYPHLSYLCSKGYVMGYPPLCDVVGSMTAQFEHTILLRPTCKEVVSRGDDY